MSGRILSALSRGLAPSSRRMFPSHTCTPWSSRLLSLNTPTRRRIQSLPDSPFFRALRNHDPNNVAVVHSKSERSFNYGHLISDIHRSKSQIIEQLEGRKELLNGGRVAFFADNSYDYVVMLLSIIACNAIAVPINPNFPSGEMEHMIATSQPDVFLSPEKYKNKIGYLKLDKFVWTDIRPKILEGVLSEESIELQPPPNPISSGMMLFTSGTTNKPKGVLLPLEALTAQAESLVKAWKYTPEDQLLHILPLHHIHGIVNGIFAPLFAGSAIEFLFPFNPPVVLERLAAPFTPVPTRKDKISILTAVPTAYSQLVSMYHDLSLPLSTACKIGLSPENLRLNMSGSAALPTPIQKDWEEVSKGNVLLERYGMTEIGMALSCGLDFTDRVDGSVGWPLPGVEVRLVDTDTGEVIEHEDINGVEIELAGEIQVRGPGVFSKYWGKKDVTEASFVPSDDGKLPWFKTGDIAIRRTVDGAGTGASGEWAKGPMYFIQGRQSVDIIKTGGEKVSALEIERAILSLPEVKECAVFGIPSEVWGEKIVASVILNNPKASNATSRNGHKYSLLDLRFALRPYLAKHKLPTEIDFLKGNLPRNAMGKVNKKELKVHFREKTRDRSEFQHPPRRMEDPRLYTK